MNRLTEIIITGLLSGAVATFFTVGWSVIQYRTKSNQDEIYTALAIAIAAEDYGAEVDRWRRHLPRDEHYALKLPTSDFPVFAGYPEGLDWRSLPPIIQNSAMGLPGESKHWRSFIQEMAGMGQATNPSSIERLAGKAQSDAYALARAIRASRALPERNLDRQPTAVATS